MPTVRCGWVTGGWRSSTCRRARSQPMVDAASGTALVFNGTIYNYPELRAELIARGHVFHSDGDTEVILRAYAAMGRGLRRAPARHVRVRHLEPRDACSWRATASASSRCITAKTCGCFRFASTPQALLAAGGVDTGIDAVALHHLFTLHAVVPAPRTIFNGIRKLAPGTTLTVNARGELSHRQYWSLTGAAPGRAEDRGRMDRGHPRKPRQAVKKRIEIADVKVGVLLSGGLDSSLLVALLAEQGVPDLMTFSVGFEDQPEERGNEFEYSDPVAAMYGTRHHKYLIPNAEVLRRLPEAVDADVRADVRAGCGGVLSAGRAGQQDGQGGAERAGRRRGVRRLFLVSAHGGGNVRLARSSASAAIISTATTTSFSR